MADELQNARIDQLPQSAGPKPGFFLAMRNMELGITQRIEVDYFLTSTSTQNFEWITDHEYAVDDVVTRSGRWWQALQINENVVPGTDPLTWLEIPKSASGFVFWAAGAFVEDEVFCLRALDQFIQIFRLVNATRPFVSSNFEAEYTAGDWELMSERGYVGIAKNAHGWPVNTLLTYKSGAWNTFTTGDTPLAIVRNVVSVNAVIVVLLGARLKGLAGLTPGSTYYGQSDGTISTTPSDNAIYLAVSATEAILFAGGTGGHVFFKGVFANEAALDAAFPTAEPGDYALVDTGGTEAELYIWDDTDTDWVASGVTTIVPAWDNTTAGVVERSTTAEAQNIVTRVAAGSSDASNSDARTPSEKGLVEMLLSFLTTAWTWTLKQTFTLAPRFSSTTASQFLKVDGSKDLTSVGSASQSDMITGTDDTLPATAKSVEDKGSVKSISISNAASGTINIDCLSRNQIKAVLGTTVTGAIEFTTSNAANLEILNITVAITGASIAITFPSTTRMDRIFEGGVWNQSTKVFTATAVGTADLFEFSLLKIGSVFELRYGGPARA